VPPHSGPAISQSSESAAHRHGSTGVPHRVPLPATAPDQYEQSPGAYQPITSRRHLQSARRSGHRADHAGSTPPAAASGIAISRSPASCSALTASPVSVPIHSAHSRSSPNAVTIAFSKFGGNSSNSIWPPRSRPTLPRRSTKPAQPIAMSNPQIPVQRFRQPRNPLLRNPLRPVPVLHHILPCRPPLGQPESQTLPEQQKDQRSNPVSFSAARPEIPIHKLRVSAGEQEARDQNHQFGQLR
jgi:hypothetical protein